MDESEISVDLVNQWWLSSIDDPQLSKPIPRT